MFSAVRESDGRAVVLKQYTRTRHAPDVEPQHAEFNALRRAAGPGVVEALEISTNQDGPVLVLARVPGISLDEWVAADEVGLERVLRVAIQLAEVFTRIHAARLLYLNLTTTNVLVDRSAAEVTLIDFRCAQSVGATRSPTQTTETRRVPHSTLAYVSPEQTGRMGRGVDSRSDLYSLGAILYYALAGHPPFRSADALELVHAHMAVVPKPLVESCPHVPLTVSRVISKLLEKDPEARYQSAAALAEDLRRCREELEQQGTIAEDFALGTAEIPSRPAFVRRLYGRESELSVLHAAYARAAAGQTEVVFLEGASGVGKTTLVNELRPQLAQANGYLARGKFDLSREEAPYAGFVQVLDSLAQQMLMESDARLARWRSALGDALGSIARVLLDLVPDLATILPDAPLVPPLGPAATLTRLSLAVQRFINAIATPEHPLVLFLDDLHWSDAGSRRLLHDLLRQSSSNALLVIAAYRTPATEYEPALTSLLSKLREASAAAATITLEPLSQDDCTAMLAGALGCTPRKAQSLARTVARKTGNVPLVVENFIDHLCETGQIRFEPGSGWVWDADALDSAGIPDDAVGFMTAKIGRLGDDARHLLKLASCVGDRFDFDSLTDFAETTEDEVQLALDALLDEGLIVPCADGLRFVHDRVQEVAESLWSDPERAALHARIGKRLLRRASPEELDARVVEIVDHLNRSASHPFGEAERVERIELNLRAGRRILAAGAADAAERYLAAARALFRESDWQRDHGLIFELHAQSAECAFASGRYGDSLRFVDTLDARPGLTPLEIARVVARRTAIFSLTRAQEEAVAAGLAGLRRLGLRLPAHPSWLRIRLTTLRSLWHLSRLQPDSLRPCDHSDPRTLPIQLILRVLIGPAFRTSWRLQCAISNYSIHAAVKRGTAAPAFSISGAAMTVAYYTGDYTRGTRHADLVLGNLELQPGQSSFFRARMSVMTFLKGFTISRRAVAVELAACRDDAAEHGDAAFALYAENLRGYLMWLVGDPLEQVEATRMEFVELCNRIGSSDEEHAPLFLGVLSWLTGRGEPFDPWHVPMKSSPQLLPIHSAWIAARCMRGDYAQAFELSEVLLPEVRRVYCNMPHVPEFWSFRGLSAGALATDASLRTRLRLRRILRQSRMRLRNWARHGPENFDAATLLLEAESVRLRRRETRALTLYRRSAEAARAYSNPHYEALARARMGELLAAKRRHFEAETPLREAARLYADWGAVLLAARIEAMLSNQVQLKVQPRFAGAAPRR